MFSRKEVIHVHIGQAGVQAGSACWELFCLEHGVQPDGTLYSYQVDHSCCHTFYSISPVIKCEPRAIMIDLEPSVIDEIRTGTYRRLFRPDSLITGKEDAANNFARGMYSVGREMLDPAMERLRRQIEECEGLQGFIFYRSFGGGTGSGFTSLLYERLQHDFPKGVKSEFGIYPSPRLSPVIVEPYNAVFSAHVDLEYQDASFIMDNEAVYNILSRSLDMQRPTYTNLNRLLAQVVATLTNSLHSSEGLNVDLRQMETNLVPFPRLHFLLTAFAPFVSVSRGYYEEPSVGQMTRSCFEPSNQMVSCHPSNGRCLCCCMMYRGNVQPTDVNSAIQNAKRDRRGMFVDWIPSAFKVGINYLPPAYVPGGDLAPVQRAMIMLSNSSAVKEIWEDIARKFRIMYKKRAFVHHYVGEGMEESEFDDAHEDIKALVSDYKEVEK